MHYSLVMSHVCGNFKAVAGLNLLPYTSSQEFGPAQPGGMNAETITLILYLWRLQQCICIRENEFIHVYIYVRMCINVYTHTCIYGYICIYMCMYVCTHKHIHTYINACTHLYIHKDIHVYVYIYIHACIWMHIYICSNNVAQG